MPNFDEISQYTAEIKLLPVSENGRPPYWNSVSCFDFDESIVIDMTFCICLPNFVVIGRSAAELWRHIDFTIWRPYSRKSTLQLRFSDGICLARRKSICMPNFGEISQSTAEIKLLPILQNGRPPYWNSISCFNFDLCMFIGMSFCISLLNFVVIGRSSAEVWYHIDFSRWRPGSRKCTSGFRFCDGIRLRKWNLHAYQISMR